MLLEVSPVGVFFIVVGGVAFIALLAFILFRILRPKLKQDEKPSEEELVKEEMNRILKPIEDDETAKAVSEYKDEDEE